MMERLRIIIADDERPARELLKGLISELGTADVIGEAENGPEAVELICATRPDLAILDLKMPGMSGLEAVRQLRKSQLPLVAFITAHDDQAVAAFQVNAIDYLLKPVEKNRLAETLARAAERLEHADWRSIESERVRTAAEHVATQREPLSRIPVRVRDEILLIPIEEVASIVADGELLNIRTIENQRYTINHRLKDLELRLDEHKFVRLSRGTIVNIDLVTTISTVPGGTYLVSLSNGQELQTSRLQSRVLRNRLLKL
jgi:two-component system, LytTR family, response regulator